MGDAAIADLHPADAGAFPKHACELADIAVGVGVRGAAADHSEEGLIPRDVSAGRRQRLVNPDLSGLQQLRIDAEIPAELDLDAVLMCVLIEDRGHIVLDVAGGKQHARDRQDMIDALVT